MRKCGLILILLFLTCISLYADEPRLVRVGAFNFYPGIFRDTDGVIKGFYVDSLAEVAGRENIRFEYVWGSWSEGLERIKSGEVDILTSVAYTPERALFMDYAKTPLLTVWSELYVPLKSEIDSITDIQGKKVALMKGDFNAGNFISMVERFHITVQTVEVTSFDEVFKAVADKTADAGVVNCTFGAAKQREYGIRSTGVVFNPFDIFFTAAKGRNSDLIEMLDKYLTNWKHQENSIYNRSRQKWSHGNVGAIEIIPEWIKYSAAVLGLMVVVFFSFTILLKIKVQHATEDILKREELLKESESKLRSYIHNSPDGVFVADSEGKYLEVNPAAESITGYSENELLKMSIPDLLNPETIDQDIKHFYTLKETGHVSSEFEYLNKNGKKRWWSVDAVKLSDMRYLGFVKDITNRKLAEEKIKNLLSEKELLLKEVHHRIKNNMNTIKGLLTLQLHSMDDPVCSSHLSDVENRIQSMIILYDKLYCSQNYRELSIKDYIENLAVEIIYNFPNRDIVKLETDIEDFILNVQLLAPLGIIVNELLTNIMKHAFTGRNSGIVKISSYMKNNTATLIINDNGKGLPEGTGFQDSTGFGLNLVNMLIQQMDGKIDVQVNEGTTFILQFKVL
jgi:PAS domain S-box-containing protein